MRTLINIALFLIAFVPLAGAQTLGDFSVIPQVQFYVIAEGDTVSTHNTIDGAVASARDYAKGANGAEIHIAHKTFLNVDYAAGAVTDTVFIDRRAKIGMTKSEIVFLWGLPDIQRDYPSSDMWFWSWCKGQPQIECYDFNFIVFKDDTTFAIKFKHQGSPLITQEDRKMAEFKLITNPTGLTGPVTDIPLYIDFSQITAPNFWSEITADGGDIRVYADSAMTVELPREIVVVNKTAQTGGMWLKGDSVSAGEDFYLTVGGLNPDYAPTDPFGRHNVWTNGQLMVHHYQSNTNDSSANGFDGTFVNGAVIGDGRLGKGLDLTADGSYVSVPGNPDTSGSFSATVWFNASAIGPEAKFLLDNGEGTNGGIQVFIQPDGNIRTRIDDTGSNGGVFDTATQIVAGQWYKLTLVVDKTGVAQMYLNGQPDGGTLDVSGYGDTSGSFGELRIGSQDDAGKEIDGFIDEVRISNVVRSPDWIQAAYNNQNDPASFYTIEEVQIDIEVTFPMERTFDIPMDDRTMAIPRENRVFAIQHDNREFIVQ